MKIPPRTHPQLSASTGQSKLQAGLFHMQNQPSLPHLSKQSSLWGNPLAALGTLEQWRVHEEDTRRQAARWDLNKIPLQVVIEPYPGKETQIATQALWATIKQWEAASQGLVRFTLLEDTPCHRNRCDILICWSDETTLGRDFEVGHTQRTVQGKQITRAVITLIQNPIIDGHLSPQKRQERMCSTLLHEIGHALGLEHSDSKQDVMYYRGWQHLYLSPGDIRGIQTLYAHNPSLQC